MFPLGSTSKTLTSLALGILLDEGKIDLDAPIQTYVPYFPKKEHAITVRQIAGHLSGIRDYDKAKGEYDNVRQFASVREAVGVFKDDPLLSRGRSTRTPRTTSCCSPRRSKVRPGASSFHSSTSES